MAYFQPYSPRFCYDELLHGPHYKPFRHSRGYLAPSCRAVNDQHLHPSPARSLPIQSEQVQTAGKTTSLVPMYRRPLDNGKDGEESTPRAMPPVSFKAAIEKLKTKNSEAYEFFKGFHIAFKDETKEIEHYVACKVLNEVWEDRVRRFETKSSIKRHEDQNQNGDDEEDRNNINSRVKSFLELRDEILLRCIMMQNTNLPKWPLTTSEDYERKNSADAFVKTVNNCIRDMIPNLQKSDRDASAMKAAVQAMEIISRCLETYPDAWKGEGVRRQEYDQEDENDW